MTLAQVRILEATVLACVLPLGGVKVFGQSAGSKVTQKAATSRPDAGDRQAVPSRELDKVAQAVDRFAGALKLRNAQRSAPRGRPASDLHARLGQRRDDADQQ